MELILLKDVEKLGSANDIVTVKNGYGRNYLIPQGIAVVANERNRNMHAAKMRGIEKQEAAKIGEYQSIAQKLENAVIEVVAKAGESGKLFGSISNIHLAQAIEAQKGVSIERKKISMHDVKELGEYTAHVVLHPEVSFDIKFEVKGE